MNRYRVFNGLATIGAGIAVLLTAEQIKPRAHNLELPEKYDPKAKDAKPALVKTKVPIQFKVGETFGLDELPKNLIGVAEPLDPPKSDRDAKAADAALRVKNPKAHAARTAEARKRRLAEKAAAKGKAA